MDGKELTRPKGAVQKLSTPLQALSVASIFAALALGTYLNCTYLAPALARIAPGLCALSLSLSLLSNMEAGLAGVNTLPVINWSQVPFTRAFSLVAPSQA